tara:strand:- start:258 stop:461 length:204 start_codon:yes stop_codon:yes gene_type:complete
MKETELCHPTVVTWFICWEDTRKTIKAWGEVLPTQCMGTPYNEVDYYIDKLVWEAILLKNGIKPLPE